MRELERRGIPCVYIPVYVDRFFFFDDNEEAERY